MKRKHKRIIWLFLMICFFWGLLPGAGRAEEGFEEYTYVNPAYQGEISSQRIVREAEEILAGSIRTYSEPETFHSVEEAGNYMRESMVNRQGTVSFQYAAAGEMSTEEFRNLCRSIVDEACAEENARSTVEGDYLRYHYGGYTASRTFTADSPVYAITYTMVYYTTYNQEAELAGRIREELSKLSLSGKNDYEKIRTIYEYICSHVTYDNSKTETDYGKYTAYNALIRGTAVCQGYASLYYRMLRESGVSARVITGTAMAADGSGQNHAWNIVRLNGWYYNTDSSWDANYKAGSYHYFLQNMGDFKNHTRSNGDKEENGVIVHSERENFASEAFHKQYPMAADSYHQWEYQVTRESTCTIQGEQTGVCKDCGKTVFYENLPLAAHTPGKFMTVEAASCTKEGSQAQRCTVCNKELEKKAIPLVEHTPGNYVIVQSSTCTVKGYQVQSCKVCGQELKRLELPLEGHVYEKKTQKESTCTEEGLILNLCKNCGAEEPNSRITVKAREHDFTAWTTVRKATIFKAGESSRSCKVCKKTESKTLKKLPSSVKLNMSSVKMQSGKTTTAVKVSKKTTGDSVSYWKSSNSKVAVVNRTTGKIRAVSAGTTYISVTMKSGATARLLLRVQKSPVKTTKLTLNRTKLTLKVNKTFRLTVKRTPVTASDKLTFKSSNSKVARVTSKGTIRAVKKGTAIITAKADSGKWAKCKVTVK